MQKKQRLPRRRLSAKIRTPARKTRAASTKRQATPAESGMLRPAPNVGAGRAPGKPPHAGEQPSFTEAKRQGMPERLPEDGEPAPPESAPPHGKERLRVLSADMPPAAGDRAASGRASGMFRPPCSLARTARGSRRARRAGQADEPRFCTVAQRLRGQKACPQAEHGSKKGKEQQKGLSSPGQSRKRKALFMFMGKR